jgi:hypothetical protein
MTPTNESYSYIAKCPKCGLLVAMAVDKPGHAKRTANLVAQCIREGFAVERVASEWVRENWHFCECKMLKSPASTPETEGAKA